VSLHVGPATDGLRGELRLPGDKSIAHRALLVGAVADGHTRLEGLPDGADVRSTLNAVEQLGVRVRRDGTRVEIEGAGLDFATETQVRIDCGNSGTTMRLLAGLLASRPGRFELTGDASLSRRPMERVAEPLRSMGAGVSTTDGHAPIQIEGGRLTPIDRQLAVPSAQVKTAILLAGLRTDGRTTVREPIRTRDHTERLLEYVGAAIHRDGAVVSIEGNRPLTGRRVPLPADVSAAAFFLVAGSIVPNSELSLLNVGLNETRTGVLRILERMGADIEVRGVWEEAGEPRGDLRVRAAPLHGVTIEAEEVPAAIDELPVLAMAAACADGETVVRGAGELRVKESDRLAAIAQLGELGATITIQPDGFRIVGGAGRPLPGGSVSSAGDHRIAMAFAVLALRTSGGIHIDGGDAMAVSFPGFVSEVERLGARVRR